MRIGLTIYGDIGQKSGGYLYDRMLVEYLRKRGHQVQIISLPARSYAGCLADNFSIQLFDKLKKSKLDLLLQDELNHPSLFLLNRKLKQATSFPIVSIVHMVRTSSESSTAWKPLYRWVESRYLNSVDGFVFNSQHTKRLVEKMVSRKKPYVVATPGGDRFAAKITDTEIRVRSRRPGPLNVIFLGNLTRTKAPHILIEASSRLSRDSIEVTLAGRQDGERDYVKKLEQQVSRSGLKDQVRFAGHLERDLLAATLATSHVLVVPSSYEGFGIAYLEGLSFGLPGIGTRAGGAKEIIQHGRNGYLIPVGDVEQLARYLKNMHEDRKLLADMSLAARRSFNTFPTWKESMERVHTFLNSYNQSSSLNHSPRRKK